MFKSRLNGFWWACAGLLLATISAEAAVTLPHVFGDSMVLQREKPVPVWGWANKGETVKVKFGDQEKSATAGEDGKWTVRLDPMPASKTGRELVVTGENTVTFKDVLVGEVWICSGQSNMEWTVGGVTNAPAEIAAAAQYPIIRFIRIPHVHFPMPQHDVTARWQVATPGAVAGCTAVGYFFARDLVQKLDVPVGLLDSNWGGTLIEPWICREGFAAQPELKAQSLRVEQAYPDNEAGQKRYQEYLTKMKDWISLAEKAVAAKQVPPAVPTEPWIGGDQQQLTRLYNGMIHPLIPYAIRGSLWYQGESNGGEGDSYFHKMQALIGGWRQLWNQGDFAFYWVQLANFQKSDPNRPEGGDGWARVREAQRKSLTIPHTGMAVIIDIGEANDIHPKNKQDVGKRLAAWALAQDYGQKVECSGPLFQKCELQGNKIRIQFDHAASGLIVGEKKGLDPVKEIPNGKVKWLAVAGEDKKFYWADAVFDGSALVVSCDQVAKPVAVRYGYAMNPDGANLYNKEGLPASPFRTDSW